MSITSETGVGSSTLLQGLRAQYHNFPYRFVSGGSIMRMRAADLNMTIEAFAAHNRSHPEEGHDAACDEMIKTFAEQDYVICEGRLPHFFMPSACHVLLRCRYDVRARRRQKQEGFASLSLLEVIERIIERDRNDNERYEALYPGCLWPEASFDIVIDTNDSNAEETLRKVVEGYTAWQANIAQV